RGPHRRRGGVGPGRAGRAACRGALRGVGHRGVGDDRGDRRRARRRRDRHRYPRHHRAALTHPVLHRRPGAPAQPPTGADRPAGPLTGARGRAGAGPVPDRCARARRRAGKMVSVDPSRAGTGRADLVTASVADDFVLSGPTRTVTAAGAVTAFADPAAAADLARRVAAGADAAPAAGIVGALAFDHGHPAALTVPARLHTSPGPWRAPAGLPALPATALDRELPGAEEHHDRVRRLIARVRAGELDKVVAARSVLLTAESPLSRSALLARLVAQDPAGHGFAVDLSAAGGDYLGRALVGASPETLDSRTGARVTARPLAGSAPRSADPPADAEIAEALLAATKNLDEHRMVV